MRRTFGSKERIALYNIAGGRCELCGEALNASFHADHIVPFSKGGETVIENGQALCPRCNMAKSNKTEDGMISVVDSHEFIDTRGVTLRKFQENFLKDYLRKDKVDYLLNAVPGAGKTIAASLAAGNLQSAGVIEKIAVTTFTDHLCDQWVAAARKVGINLVRADSNIPGMFYHNQYDGLVMTYQMMNCNELELRRSVSKFSTMLIADEVHHCGEGKHLSWGRSLGSAFDGAKKRLSLSGTPFRTDRNKIPFINYKSADDGFVCVPDYSYTYRDARRDGVICWVHTHAVGGKSTWIYNGDQHEYDFEEELPKNLSVQRKHTIVPVGIVDDFVSIWGKEALIAAIRQRDLIRCNPVMARAAMLVVTVNVEAAEAVAEFLESIPGAGEVIVAHYKRDRASDEIKRFQNGQGDIIVSPNMINEGVDIPRLKVGVWLTNKVSPLSFHQYIGRISRVVNDWGNCADQECHNFMPKIPEFEALIKSIGEDNEYSARSEYEDEDIDDQNRSIDLSGNDQIQSDFESLSATYGSEFNFVDSDQLTIQEKTIFETMRRNGISASLAQIRAVMRELGGGLVAQNLNSMREPEIPSVNLSPSLSDYHDPFADAKSKRSTLTRRLARKMNSEFGLINIEDLQAANAINIYGLIGKALGEMFGYISNPELTLQNVNSANEQLKSWLKESPETVKAELLKYAR